MASADDNNRGATPNKNNAGSDSFLSNVHADVAANSGGREHGEAKAAVAAAKAELGKGDRPPAISNRSKTDSTSPPPRPAHNRNVSFGAASDSGQPTRSPGGRPPFMPQASRDSLNSSPSSAGRKPTIATTAPMHYHHPDRRPPLDRAALSMRLKQAAAAPPATNPMGRVTLEDLLGQGKYESEAETNILAAFEATQNHQGRGHNRNPSNTSAIFSGVPGNLTMDMMSDDEDGQNLTNKSHDSEVDYSNRTPSAGREENKALLSLSPPTNPNTPKHNKFRMLAKKAAANQKHRRNMTVEDQLGQLHFAMTAFHEAASDSHDSDDSHPSATMDMEPGEDPSAGELLGHQAGLLLGTPSRKRTKSEDHRNDNNGGHMPTLKEDENAKNSLSDTSNLDGSGRSGESDGDVENQVEGLSTAVKKKQKRHSKFHHAANKVKEDLDTWQNFFSPRRDTFWVFVKRMLFYVVIPLTGIAAILFYLGGNPRTGLSEDGAPGDKPSVSWCLLFAVRQVVTFSIALSLQSIIIDFLCVGTRIMVKILGPILTLLIVQAKGWPFVSLMWGLVNFGMLHGNNRFVRHWAYWQNVVKLFNDTNPSGRVVDSDWNTTILLIMVCVSLAVALKRFLVGLYLGRQTFNHFGAQLAKVMSKMVLIAEVSQLPKQILQHLSESNGVHNGLGKRLRSIKNLQLDLEDDNESAVTGNDDHQVINASRRDALTGSLVHSERMKLMQLLERWEEPEKESSSKSAASIASVLKFRNALAFINNLYPFSYAFGLADTRENCIESAQDLYKKLLLQPNGIKSEMLRFETLALCAQDETNGEIDQVKAKDLVRVFRPDRQGNLSVLDFIKSVDTVYKELRFLQASIENSSQIDKSFETMVNAVFYVIVVCIILSQLGFDPFSLFLSMSSIILAFAFAIGSASAKFFEGLLFILVRRPYGIGDMIHVSNIESGTALEGSTGWTVNNVTLYETEMTWLPTMERASVSNGSLANSRIINWARSPNARFVMFLIFPIDTPYETLEIFKVAVEEYLKARPREWLALNAFRVNYLQGEKSFMRIEVVIQHRESWQNVGTILDSKGNFMSYCTEVQKMLGIQYKAPHLPIEMHVGDANTLAKEFLASESYNVDDSNYGKAEQSTEGRIEKGEDLLRNENATSTDRGEMFRSLAQNRYNIRV